MLQPDPVFDVHSASESHRRISDFEPLLAPYRDSCHWRSCWQLISTLALFVVAWSGMYWSLAISYLVTLALAIPTSLLMVRLFMIQHDCGHGSFFRWKRANDAVGSLLGVLTFTPYACWRREHSVHHACSGNLDRRGQSGEIYMMTLNEYRAAGWWRRLVYRVYRNPLVLFGIAPVFQFAIRQRLPFELPKTWRRERRSIHLTNLALLGSLLSASLFLGPWQVLAIELPVLIVAAQVGVWPFYVQHQYEGVFFANREHWSYVDAALLGSSFYRLPKILQWFTASIGFHHVHHLDSRIPNYRLQQCHDRHPELQPSQELTLLPSLATVRVKLWDEATGGLVGFRAADQRL